jgi:hypothetical protein
MKAGDRIATPDGPAVVRRAETVRRWVGRRSYPVRVVFVQFPTGLPKAYLASEVRPIEEEEAKQTA